ASSLALLGVLMYATMGHMMLGWPLPPWFTQPEPNHVAMGLAQLLLSGAVLALNGRHFFFPPAPRLCVLCVPPFAFFAFSSWAPRGQPPCTQKG
ncbi:MAG: hypothetical protein IJS32_03925, partial [Kiritimatiellae bacterium]|nr:hypothetical protein [Kiritimatiellia bacterium]